MPRLSALATTNKTIERFFFVVVVIVVRVISYGIYSDTGCCVPPDVESGFRCVPALRTGLTLPALQDFNCRLSGIFAQGFVLRPDLLNCGLIFVQDFKKIEY